MVSSRIPTDPFERLAELPARNYISLLRNRVADLRRELPATPAYYDQYPGKTVPRCFSKLYGPIALTAARRDGNVGFLANAQLASPSTFILPNGTNILTARVGAFDWWEVNVFAFLSATWTDAESPGPIDTRPAGGLFDPVIEANGGAQCLLNFTNNAFTIQQPKICFEIELYDKKRGSSITDGPVPVQTFAGATFGNKKFDTPCRFDVDTEIEPRIYIKEFRFGTALDTDAAYESARVTAHINLVLNGVDVFEDRQVSSLDRTFTKVPNPADGGGR